MRLNENGGNFYNEHIAHPFVFYVKFNGKADVSPYGAKWAH